MGIRGLDVFNSSGCTAVIDEEVCGRDANASIHRPSAENGHEYQE